MNHDKGLQIFRIVLLIIIIIVVIVQCVLFFKMCWPGMLEGLPISELPAICLMLTRR